MADLLRITKQGLYCPIGDFFIDPSRRVDRALITHGHADHARPGSTHYVTATPGVGILKARLGNRISIEGLDYGRRTNVNGVTVSFHPAGHVLGSAQIRVEYRGEVWVVSGDYKLEDDKLSQAFEPIPCHVFITESTFGLPIYKWPSSAYVFSDIHQWWLNNQSKGYSSVLLTYSLGKAQRLLFNLDASLGPIVVHDSIRNMTEAYEGVGISFPHYSTKAFTGLFRANPGTLILAPPSILNSGWLSEFEPYTCAFVSGWMRVRKNQYGRQSSEGFVLSDHADWPGLLSAIEATGAERIFADHGFASQLARYLKEKGKDARVLKTQ